MLNAVFTTRIKYSKKAVRLPNITAGGTVGVLDSRTFNLDSDLSPAVLHQKPAVREEDSDLVAL